MLDLDPQDAYRLPARNPSQGRHAALRVAIHQPNFYPRLKVLQKLANSDLVVMLDDVQYCNREWQNRTRIVPISNRAPSFWLSVPAQRPNGRATKIKDVEVCDPVGSYKRCVLSLESAYSSSSFMSMVRSTLPLSPCSFVADWAVYTTVSLLEITGLSPLISFASHYQIHESGSRRIAALCEAVGASEYLADSGASHYLRTEDFPSSVKVLWQDWRPPRTSYTDPRLANWRDISPLNLLARGGDVALSHHVRDLRLSDHPIS